MSSIVLTTAKYRIPIILTVFLLTVMFTFFIVGAPGLQFNPDLRSLIPKASLENKINKERKNSDYLVVALEAIPEGPELFSRQVLYDIQKVIQTVNSMDDLKVAISPFEQIRIAPLYHNNQVRSFSTLPILKRGRGAEVNYPLESDEEIQQFREELLTNPFTRRLVINDNASMIAFMIDHAGYPSNKTLPDTIGAILDQYDDSFSYSMAGTAYFEKFVAGFLVSDLLILMGLGLLLSLVLFFFSFRALRAVFLPASVVLIGTIWMLGTMALMKIELSVVSIVCPPLILALASSYCIHVLNQYYRDAASKDRKKNPLIVFKAISRINTTILMASATTVIALFGLLVTKITQTREFAFSVAFGIIYSAVLALFYLPAVLSMFKLPPAKKQHVVKEGFIARSLRHLAPWIIKWRYALLTIFLIISFSPVISQHFMSYDSDYITYFPHENPAVVQTAKISRNLSGVTQLYIDYQINDDKLTKWLNENGHSDDDDRNHATFYHDYEALKAISAFEKELRKNQNVRYLLSFPLILCETNQITNGVFDIPEDSAQRQKLDMIFKVLRSRKSTQFELINSRADRITTAFRLADLNNSHGYIKEEDLTRFVHDLNKQLDSALPPYVDAMVDGSRVDFIGLRNQMNKDLKYSTALSIFLILVTLSLVFRNLAYGVYSLVPMISGICLNFTIMAITGIPLDMTTIMVSSVAIGIGVDDSVHFLLKFHHFYNEMDQEEDRFKAALIQTMEHTGRPIILTSVSIIFGMSMMLFASFTPIAYFGFLVALALFTTTIGCLVFLPMTISIHYKLREKMIAHKKNQLDSLND